MLPVRGATLPSDGSRPQEVFQSMLPVRGATIDLMYSKVGDLISIHAPRAGSDGKIRQNTGCILAK